VAKKIKGLNLYDNLDVSNTQNDDELIEVYQKWANNYDDDNDNLLGTVSQPTSVRFFEKYVENKTAKIIDVGCGTGLVGSELAKKGYNNYDGIDISQDMLDIAKTRGYSNLFLGSLNDKQPFNDNAYAGALCVGVFTHGHVGPGRLVELARIVRPGGILCFTVNEGVYSDYGFDRKIQELEANNVWQVLEFNKSDYMTKKQVQGLYFLAKIQ